MLLPIGQQRLLNQLHTLGAFKIDTENGFRLSVHDRNPNAPLSPFYVNLRTKDNPKPGPLTAPIVSGIGLEIYQAAHRNRLEFDAVCGIPNAGKPFASAVRDHLKKLGRDAAHICIKREETSAGRRSFKVHGDYRAGKRLGAKRVLLVDDLVTTATVKEQCIDALERAGHRVSGVAVFLDRRNIKAPIQLRGGVPCAAAVRISDVLESYRFNNMITEHEYTAIRQYLASA